MCVLEKYRKSVSRRKTGGATGARAQRGSKVVEKLTEAPRDEELTTEDGEIDVSNEPEEGQAGLDNNDEADRSTHRNIIPDDWPSEIAGPSCQVFFN